MGKLTTVQSFWGRVKIGPENECWEWTGYTIVSGGIAYGRVGFQKKDILVHRLAYLLSHGSIDDSLEVCHSCDNGLCCNPNHLWQGTHRENMQDAVKKGRIRSPNVKGSQHGLSKLTENQVIHARELFAMGVPIKEIAEKSKVTYYTMWKILKRKRWTHV